VLGPATVGSRSDFYFDQFEASGFAVKGIDCGHVFRSNCDVVIGHGDDLLGIQIYHVVENLVAHVVSNAAVPFLENVIGAGEASVGHTRCGNLSLEIADAARIASGDKVAARNPTTFEPSRPTPNDESVKAFIDLGDWGIQGPRARRRCTMEFEQSHGAGQEHPRCISNITPGTKNAFPASSTTTKAVTSAWC
jgi:hypothetical protein